MGDEHVPRHMRSGQRIGSCFRERREVELSRGETSRLYGEVRVYDANGNLKKVITMEELADRAEELLGNWQAGMQRLRKDLDNTDAEGEADGAEAEE